MYPSHGVTLEGWQDLIKVNLPTYFLLLLLLLLPFCYLPIYLVSSISSSLYLGCPAHGKIVNLVGHCLARVNENLVIEELSVHFDRYVDR